LANPLIFEFAAGNLEEDEEERLEEKLMFDQPEAYRNYKLAKEQGALNISERPAEVNRRLEENYSGQVPDSSIVDLVRSKLKREPVQVSSESGEILDQIE